MIKPGPHNNLLLEQVGFRNKIYSISLKGSKEVILIWAVKEEALALKTFLIRCLEGRVKGGEVEMIGVDSRA